MPHPTNLLSKCKKFYVETRLNGSNVYLPPFSLTLVCTYSTIIMVSNEIVMLSPIL